jgi:hypothetical protein
MEGHGFSRAVTDTATTGFSHWGTVLCVDQEMPSVLFSPCLFVRFCFLAAFSWQHPQFLRRASSNGLTSSRPYVLVEREQIMSVVAGFDLLEPRVVGPIGASDGALSHAVHAVHVGAIFIYR